MEIFPQFENIPNYHNKLTMKQLDLNSSTFKSNYSKNQRIEVKNVITGFLI